MPDAAGEQAGGVANPARDARGGVDDRVPFAGAERLQLAGVAVAVQGLDLREERRIRPAAVEERDLVAARLRRLDQMPAEEERPAQDQHSHRTTSPFTRHS